MTPSLVRALGNMYSSSADATRSKILSKSQTRFGSGRLTRSPRPETARNRSCATDPTNKSAEQESRSFRIFAAGATANDLRRAARDEQFGHSSHEGRQQSAFNA